MRGYDQSMTADDVTFDMAFQDPDDPNVSGSFKSNVSSISASGAGMLPLEAQDTTDMAALIEAGFDAKGTLTYANGSSDITVTNAETGTFKVQTNTQSGGLTVDLSGAGIAYDVQQEALNAAVTMQGMPLPFEIAMAQSGFKVAVPIAKSDTAQDFALGITMREFILSDMIWGMFDPAGQLPRDPADVLAARRGGDRFVQARQPIHAAHEEFAVAQPTPGLLVGQPVTLGEDHHAALGVRGVFADGFRHRRDDGLLDRGFFGETGRRHFLRRGQARGGPYPGLVQGDQWMGGHLRPRLETNRRRRDELDLTARQCAAYW